MKTTDLRLGNLVMYNNQIVKTTGLHYDMFECVCPNDNNWMCTGSISDVRPIELTEEVLVKIGFKKIELVENEQYKYYKKICVDNYSYILDFIVVPKDEYICLHIIYDENEDEDDEFGYYSTIFYNDNIKYLHELQNVYYCLTGQELEVEL